MVSVSIPWVISNWSAGSEKIDQSQLLRREQMLFEVIDSNSRQLNDSGGTDCKYYSIVTVMTSCKKVEIYGLIQEWCHIDQLGEGQSRYVCHQCGVLA